MNQKFECIEKHLYRRQYQTATGGWSTLYYAIFVDWKGIRRHFPLGEHLDRARNKLGEYRRKNDAEFDFDKDKTEREAREMTFSKWLAACAKSESDKRHLKHLEAFLGDVALSGISDDHVKKYREKRSGEKIVRHGNASKKLLSQTTINKEISTLRKFLRLARKKGFADKVTEFKMAPEKSRKRILTDDEYKVLLENCPAWLRRACVMAWETCLSRSDLLALTWEEINLKESLIELKNDRAKTGAEQAIPIVTPELKALLAELQAERRRLPNVDGIVLTMDGKLIDELKFEYWFRKSREDAGIKNFMFHDFRHCAITRWAAAGIPTAAAMIAAGHKSVQSHKKYQNLQRDHLKNGFQTLLTSCLHEKESKSESAANA
jgi:integrase